MLEELQKHIHKLSTSPSTRLETTFQSRDDQSKSSRESSHRAFGILDRSLNSLRDAVKDKVLSSRDSAVHHQPNYDSSQQKHADVRPEIFQRNVKTTAQSYRELNKAASKIQRAFREWRWRKYRKYKAKRIEGNERDYQGCSPLKSNQDVLNTKRSVERFARKEIDGTLCFRFSHVL